MHKKGTVRPNFKTANAQPSNLSAWKLTGIPASWICAIANQVCFIPVKAVGRHLSLPLTEVAPKTSNLHVVHEGLGLAGKGSLAKDEDEPVIAEKGFNEVADGVLC